MRVSWLLLGLSLAGCLHKPPPPGPTAADAFRAGVALMQEAGRAGIDYEAAHARFVEAEALGAGPRASFDAAFTAEKLGRIDEAILHYRRAADADPGYQAAVESLSALLLARGEAGEAISRLTALAAREPSARASLLWALVEARRHDEAIALGREMLRQRPDDDRVYLALSRSHAYRGEIEHARLLAEHALALRPSSPDILNDLGLLSLEADDSAGAVAHFQAALAVDPSEPSASANLGLIALGAGDFERAAHHLGVAAPLMAGDLELQRALAVALRGAGDPRGALAQYEALVARCPACEDACIDVADIQARSLRSPKRAAEILRAHLAKHPEISADDPLHARLASLEAASRPEPRKPDPKELLQEAQRVSSALRARLASKGSCIDPEAASTIEGILDQSDELIGSGDAELAGDVLLVLADAEAELASALAACAP